jgi:hypothetical protein
MCCDCVGVTKFACKTMLVVFTFISLSSLVSNSIGETGARELLTALQFNKALAKL